MPIQHEGALAPLPEHSVLSIISCCLVLLICLRRLAVVCWDEVLCTYQDADILMPFVVVPISDLREVVVMCSLHDDMCAQFTLRCMFDTRRAGIIIIIIVIIIFRPPIC